MNFSNTKRTIESLALTLTRLNNEKTQYNSEVNKLADQDYRRRFSEDAQAEDRARINNAFRARLASLIPSLRNEAAKFQDAFEKDVHSIPCEREALNSCLMYLNISKAAYDKAALEALMMPCARLPGSLTTHCALALPAKSRHRQIIIVILVLMLLWILVVVILRSDVPAAASPAHSPRLARKSAHPWPRCRTRRCGSRCS